MAKAKTTKKDKTDDAIVISEYSGNEIIEGDKNDPDVHDGQAWREGRVVGVQPDETK